MGLETATYISGLNSSNPVGTTDPKSQGDDHLRLIKTTLLNTFPNITGAMNASHTELNHLVGITGKTGTGNVVLSASPTFTGTISGLAGSGANLTSLNASELSSGTVPNARIDASAIDHDALLGFVANEHINHGSVSITAGSGLTGGGTIAASRTINVGAGDGISVTADAVAVDSTVIRTTGAQSIGGVKTFTSNISMSGTRAIDATTRLNLTGSTVSLGESGGNLGFFGAAGGTKETITGQVELGTTNGEPLRQLIGALAAHGLIVNNTTTV